MSSQFKGRRDRKTRQGGRVSPAWFWIAIAALVLLVGGYFTWQYLGKPVFVFEKGEAELLVLLRDQQDGVYTVKYQGRGAIKLTSLTVMLEGQILNVDVKDVTLVHGDQSVVLEKAKTVPAGTDFTLQPGESFDVKVTLVGRTKGGNYLYGFQIGYQRGTRDGTYQLTANHQYVIFVK